MRVGIAFALIGFACAMLQPKQPRSIIATFALATAVMLLRSS